METLIAIAFASLTGAICGFLYGLVWSRDRLEEAKSWMADAMDAYAEAQEHLDLAIATFDDTQEVREKVEKATGVTIVPVRGRIGG